MNIVIINLHSAVNEGDRLLLEITLNVLKETFPYARITLAANDPESFVEFLDVDVTVVPSLTWWFKRVQEGHSRWMLSALLLSPFLIGASFLTVRKECQEVLRLLPPSHRAFLEALLSADIVIAAPGNYLYSSGRLGLALLLALLNQLFAVAANRPIYLFPQTIGPLIRWWEYHFLTYVLAASRLIFLRDTVSIHALAAGTRPWRALVVPDMAFAIRRLDSSLGQELLTRYSVPIGEGPLLGVTVLDWERLHRRFTRQTEYEIAVARAMDFFVRKFDGYVVVFPQVRGPSEAENDLLPSRRVCARVQHRERVYLVEEVPSTRHLISAYGLMDLFLGTRLHSVLFALTQGVPVLAIAYQAKTLGVLQTVGLESWVIPIESVEADALQARLTALWVEREVVHARLLKIKEQMWQQVRWVGELVRRDWEQCVQ